MLVTQRSPQLPPACQAWPWRGTVIYGSLSPGSYAATARWQKRRGAAGSADLAEGPVQPRRRGRAKGRGPWRGRGVVDAVGAGGGEAVRVVHRKEAVRVEGRAALVFAGGAQHGAAARLVHLHRLPPTHPTPRRPGKTGQGPRRVGEAARKEKRQPHGLVPRRQAAAVSLNVPGSWPGSGPYRELVS